MRGNSHCKYCGGIVSSWNHWMHGDRCMSNVERLEKAGFIPAIYKMHSAE